ncbi:MAG TPA: hypothetical protein HPP80_11125 [Rhodospirillaceae bacterium]|nr:hypothetical protein [Rhodospirillaceae bacterium]
MLLLLAHFWLGGGWGAAAAPVDLLPPANSPDFPAIGDEREVAFDQMSSRLASDQAKRFDRLGASLANKSNVRLRVTVYEGSGGEIRRFAEARLAAVTGELSKRGLSFSIRHEFSPGKSSGRVSLTIEGLSDPKEAVQPSPVGEPRAEKPAALPVFSDLPSPAVSVGTLWTAGSGKSLKEVLNGWCEQAGWHLVWQSNRRYPMEASADFSGSFEEAARQLVEGFAEVAPAPFGHFYKGNKVLVITSGEGR